ncbi:SHSP domain-containing protein [Candidatus Hydrogenisulfobacillus filiaventi]|uniref:SHSP domain-containing protein n=1 Tax=Candidatus Hydrogenisulfobacillus filiaventi TaxID=2707344 RepID=A0A6F8ZIE2_9FIRM|nr:SHSP domain-containing protein [Candidatus Hydrogenisulfobacillus filiaventi]
MSLIRWDPEDFLRWRDFREDMNRMWTWLAQAGENRPRTRLHQLDDAYLVEFEIPGIDPQTVDLEVDIDGATLKGAFPPPPGRPEDEAEAFESTVGFPGEVDPDRAEATYRHGLLSVRVPKARGHRRRLAIAEAKPQA